MLREEEIVLICSVMHCLHITYKRHTYLRVPEDVLTMWSFFSGIWFYRIIFSKDFWRRYVDSSSSSFCLWAWRKGKQAHMLNSCLLSWWITWWLKWPQELLPVMVDLSLEASQLHGCYFHCEALRRKLLFTSCGLSVPWHSEECIGVWALSKHGSRRTFNTGSFPPHGPVSPQVKK